MYNTQLVNELDGANILSSANLQCKLRQLCSIKDILDITHSQTSL